ncbi:hypothetical protein POF50_013200 [Streptomyces sp. SL13]|uniref:Septum formation-related domain-containing protein n=1 Tax=Streptantibioticus silvisoli TaxID=2705255 RepID=A0AA90KGJ8_9ACTN|nr:hypothetical protein [Streptantibioticus silvisoli]MDI5970289.1 hypothetical protein [Streptantibioticus silvisoli]
MSFPPPPNDAPPPGSGGGFGPPQGFGPPPPPGGGYGQQPPAQGGYGGYGGYGPPGPGAPGGYGSPPPPGPGGPGGYGPYPPPPPKRGKGARIAGVVVGLVLLAALVIGGIVWLGSGYDDQGSQARGTAPAGGAAPSPAAGSGGGSGGSSGDTSPGAGISDDPSDPSPSAAYTPYVKLSPGTCFDSPGLDADINLVTRISCHSPHDGEVIADERLTGTLTDETAVQTKALALCKPDAERRLKSFADDGKMYYNYALYPNLTTYEIKGENTVSCALTLSNHQGGALMDAPLP